jgi:hypothetical protein
MCLITTGHARRSLDTVHTHHSLVWTLRGGSRRRHRATGLRGRAAAAFGNAPVRLQAYVDQPGVKAFSRWRTWNALMTSTMPITISQIPATRVRIAIESSG